MVKHGFESFIHSGDDTGATKTTFVCLCGFYGDRAAYDGHIAQAPPESVVPDDGPIKPDHADRFPAAFFRPRRRP